MTTFRVGLADQPTAALHFLADHGPATAAEVSAAVTDGHGTYSGGLSLLKEMGLVEVSAHTAPATWAVTDEGQRLVDQARSADAPVHTTGDAARRDAATMLAHASDLLNGAARALVRWGAEAPALIRRHEFAFDEQSQRPEQMDTMEGRTKLARQAADHAATARAWSAALERADAHTGGAA